MKTKPHCDPFHATKRTIILITYENLYKCLVEHLTGVLGVQQGDWDSSWENWRELFAHSKDVLQFGAPPTGVKDAGCKTTADRETF